jgi:hypothetical protein
VRYGDVAGHGVPGIAKGILTGFAAGGAGVGLGVAVGSAAKDTKLGAAISVIGGVAGLSLGVFVGIDQARAPDNPARRPKLYKQYVEQLTNAFLEARGGKGRLSADQLQEFTRKVSSTEDEDEQIKIIRAEFKERFGADLPSYAPEKSDDSPELSNIPGVTRDPAILKNAAEKNFQRYQQEIRR